MERDRKLFRKGVRTVQRYELDQELPILRQEGKSRHSVIALKADLHKWLGAGDPRDNLTSRQRALSERSNQLGQDFLEIDSQVALTFSGIALGARDPQKRRRSARTARRAYETITRLRTNLNLNPKEMGKLDANVQRLKSELKTLGEID
jgi:hypothetical protein